MLCEAGAQPPDGMSPNWKAAAPLAKWREAMPEAAAPRIRHMIGRMMPPADVPRVRRMRIRSSTRGDGGAVFSLAIGQ